MTIVQPAPQLFHTSASHLNVYVDGIGLLGPGLPNWQETRAVLRQELSYSPAPCQLPAPQMLPPAERRRCGPIIKLSLAVGVEAAEMAKLDLSTLATVFSASGGDGANCNEICTMLASDDRLISPTRFHNSVHNAAAGYWSIAAKSMATSSVLCAYDGSFGAGLLEAATQVKVEQIACMVVAGDTRYPEPLHATRPISDAFGLALALVPERTHQSLAQITISMIQNGSKHESKHPNTQMADPALEALRTTIPTARALPLLKALAEGMPASIALDYLDNLHLLIQVTPCN